jgi:hypothetical protein
MDTLQSAFVPIFAMWVVFDSLMKAATVLNRLRESAVCGHHDGVRLTFAHPKGMFFDWCLTMFGVIAATLLTGVVVWLLADPGLDLMQGNARIATRVASVFPFAGALAFGLCAISDLRLIRRALREAEAS